MVSIRDGIGKLSRRLIPGYLALLVTGVLLVGCATGGDISAQSATESDGRLPVVTTTTILADLVREVGGPFVTVTSLLGQGVDPHTFEPAPADVRTLAGARLVFVNGAGLDSFMDRLIENAGGDFTVVVVSNGLTPRTFGEEAGHEDEAAHEGDEHEHTGEIDPHFWMSPYHTQHYVRTIRDALSAADPAHKAEYEANAATYLSELEALDAWILAETATLPSERRLLVTNHHTLGYFAERYGYTIVGAVIPGASSEAEPSARALAALADKIRATGAPAIFTESTVSPQLAQQLAAEVGREVQVVPLYTDSLGPAGSEAESYLTMIRSNVTAIVTALK